MSDIDLGIATDVMEGDRHARVKLRQNQRYPTASQKKDILIQSPLSIELYVNANGSSSQEADKIFFSAHDGVTKKIVGVLDSQGNLRIAGSLLQQQTNLSYND